MERDVTPAAARIIQDRKETMNILKLAKHLKEFTLDEIEMIAEDDCKTELKELLKEHKIVFENEKYKYVEQESLDFDIFISPNSENKNISVENAIKIFLEAYVKNYCKPKTFRTYRGTFKAVIIPFFRDKKLADISILDIQKFYLKCKDLDFKPLKIKNTLALLKQFIKYFQEQGVIDTKCTFQVRRLTAKNEFSENRLTFKENS